MSYYVTNENSFLDIKNAHLRVTGNVHTDVLKVGSIGFQPAGSNISGTVNFTNVTTGVTTTSNLNVGGTLNLGTIELSASTHTLDHITARGNVTSTTVQFNNATTGLVTTSNVEVGGELVVTGNATVSSNLTVSGNVEVGTANLFVDTASSRVGIGTTSPQEKLHVYGAPMIQHDTTYQYVDPGSNPAAPTAWYKLGEWEGSDSTGQGANLKLTLLGGSGYHGPHNNKSGETVIHAKLLNNQDTSVANIGGMFYSIGNPMVHQVKFKQVDTNRNKYEVHAEVVEFTQHNMSIECSMTTSFTRSFTTSSDPGVDGPAVRAAKFTHIINESGYLGIDTKTPSGTLEVSSTRTGFSGLTTNEATLMISCTDEQAADSGDIGGGVVFRQRWNNPSASLVPTGGIYGYKDRNSGSYGGGLLFTRCPDNGTGDLLTEAMRITKEGNVVIGTTQIRGGVDGDIKFSTQAYTGVRHVTASTNSSGYVDINVGKLYRGDNSGTTAFVTYSPTYISTSNSNNNALNAVGMFKFTQVKNRGTNVVTPIVVTDFYSKDSSTVSVSINGSGETLIQISSALYANRAYMAVVHFVNTGTFSM